VGITFRSRRRGGAPDRAIPVLVALASLLLTVAAWDYGGVVLPVWHWVLAGICTLALAVWLVRPPNGFAPVPAGTFLVSAALLSIFGFLQLVPLPSAWVARLSPARSRIAGPLSVVGLARDFVPLSAAPGATREALARLLGGLLVFFLVRELGWRCGRRVWAMSLPLVILGMFESTVGLVQSFSAVPGSAVAAHGTFVNPNHLAGLVEMCLPFAVALAWAVLRRHTAPDSLPFLRAAAGTAAGISALLLLAGVLYTNSRTGFAATVTGLVAMAVVRAAADWRRHPLWTRGALLGVTAIPFLLLLVSPDQLLDRLAATGTTPGLSPESRFAFWNETLHLMSDYPVFGCGLGAYGSVIQQYRHTAPLSLLDHAHNDYLEYAAELGLTGMLPLIACAGLITVRAFRTATGFLDEPNAYAASACVAALAAISLHSLADFNLQIPANILVLAWIAGLACALDLRAAVLAGRQEGVFTVPRS